MSSDSQTMDLSQRVALVTGGSRGIGLAIARALLDAGARVTITARTTEHLDEARKDLAAGGSGRAGANSGGRRRCERRRRRRRAIDGAVQQFGGLDILVNNAGIGVFRPSPTLTSTPGTT